MNKTMFKLNNDIARFCDKWHTTPEKVKDLLEAVGRQNGIRAVMAKIPEV